MSGKLPFNAFFDEIADAIANPSPSRPMREAVGRQGRKVCDAVSVVPPWLRSLPGLQRDALFAVCAPYWDEQSISPPVETAPFTGGQCAVNYNQNIETFNAGGSYGVDSILSITGPIVSRSIVQVSAFSYSMILTNAVGVVSSRLADSFQGNLPRFGALSRVDGQPDSCGDPPGDIEPGPNPSPNPPVLPVDEQPFNDPESGPILPIPDIPSAPGFPSVPWRNPFAPGNPSTGIPGDPGTPGDFEDSTGPDDAVEGEAEPGNELVALKLTLLNTPPFSQPLQNSVYRSVAFVYMGTVAGLDQDSAGALVRDGQLVYAERSGLTKWRVAANVGFTVRVTPFYQEVN